MKMNPLLWFFMPIAFGMRLLRKPAFWVALVLLSALWFWRSRSRVNEVAELEALTEELTIDAEVRALQARQESPVVADSAGSGSRTAAGTGPELEFVFPPQLCESITSKFHGRMGRMPTNWADITASGSATNIPPARPGYKYVYDARFGMIEQVKDTEAHGSPR